MKGTCETLQRQSAYTIRAYNVFRIQDSKLGDHLQREDDLTLKDPFVTVQKVTVKQRKAELLLVLFK